MEKYLVTIEFRYKDAPRHEDDYTSREKKVTIGVYEDFEDACKHGNEVLEKLEKKFGLHQYPHGGFARRDRFSKKGGCFGSSKTLVTNLAFLKTPFEFYAKITTLKFDSVDKSVDDVINAVNKYREFKKTEEE